MKQFYPTYLYIKTHNTTGLKYFGKTTKDPHKYRGSGKHWLSHLKMHGNNITTEIIGYFTVEEECRRVAESFSREHNIVDSKEWANMIIENGLDGGNTNRTNYKPHSLETRTRMSESRKGIAPWNKGSKGLSPGNKLPRTKEQKLKISKSLKGRKRDPAASRKTAEKLRGRKRPEISAALTGLKRSAATIEKMKLAQQNREPIGEETRTKIRSARLKQVNVFPLGAYVKGRVIVVDKFGNKTTIPKEVYYAQTGPKEEWEWVSHKSKEAISRRR